MRTALLLALLALSLPACGGSSGTGGFGSTSDAFLGEYGYARFRGSEMSAYGYPRTIAEAAWGHLAADGMGMWHTLDDSYNTEGSVGDAAILGGTVPYTLDDLHGLALNPNETGVLGAGGAVGSTIEFTPPGIRLMCRSGGAIVPGKYAMFLFQYATGGAPPGSDAAAWGTLTLDGGTLGDVLFSGNTNGSVSLDVVGPPGGTYASTSEGAAQLSLGNLDVEGTVGPGGQMVIMAGSTADGTNLQVVFVLVRLGSGASNALFSGDYDGVGIEGPTSVGGAPAWSVHRQTLRADGMGSFQQRVAIGSTDGRYLPGSTSFGPMRAYTVAADGTIQTPTQRGALTADGRVIVLAGGVSGGSRPSFAFYAK